jgi:DNA topoisomerase-2
MIIGNYPLKGKPLNVNDVDIKKLILNQEFSNIMTIMGLQIGVKVKDPKELYFGKLCIFSDQDLDGFHISGLLINMFHKFWPELFEMGIMYRLRTPLIIVKLGKEELEFFDENVFKKWKMENTNKKFTSKYYKGLGSFKTPDFKKILHNYEKYLVPLTIEDDDDRECVDLAFNKKRSDDRKVWLGLEN